jgi:pilus assembly protein FimV
LIKGSNVHKSKINKISLAVCLAFMPIYGFAAGLGKLNVDSGLGEPLKAQIDLLSVTPDELSSLTAAIASEEAYAVQGIPRLGVHNSIKVELAKNPDGSPVLKLRSQQPIDDPYLDMLIQVDWASGRLLREYTILLDPPGYKQAADEEPVTKSAINKPYAASGANVSTGANVGMYEVPQRLVDKSKSKKKASSSGSSQNAQKETTVAVNDSVELTTQRGDTLISIAKEVSTEGVSLDQVMVGLFEANKKAFTDGNMNRLKVGQIIRVPSKEELAAVDSKQAKNEIKVHASNWNAYKNSLAGNVVAAPVAEEVEQKQSASGKIATAEDKAALTKSGPQDVVKLSAGGKVAAQGGKGSAEADAKVLALQEEATAREKALKEANDRTTALEAQVADMQKLLALKSQTMADMQKNADVAANTAESKPPATTPQPAPIATGTAVPEATVEPAATPEPETATPAEDIKKAPAVVIAPVQPMPEEEPSFLTSLLESVNLFMLGGAGGVALLGTGWLYLRNKRRRDLDSFERGILTSGGLRANTVFGNTTGNATSSADTSFLTDFAQSADGGMIDTNDVDPIAEAEVYMAYGRDAQAEEILKDAISKEPKRYELHLKLLEMYAARKDVSAFEAIAGELYTTLGADDPTWAKVAELGIAVEPDNPLYDISQITPSIAAVKPVESSADAVVVDVGNDLDFSFDKLKSDNEVESSLDMQSSSSSQDELGQVKFDQDTLEKESFDLGGSNSALSTNTLVDSSATASASADNTVVDGKSVADNSMDFDFPELGSFTLGNEQSATANEQPASEVVSQQESAPVFELPASSANDEIEFTTAAPTEDSSALAGLDFNFNSQPVAETTAVATESSDFNFEGFADAITPVEEEKLESGALDSTDFNFEDFGAPVAEANQEKTEVSALEGISLNFETEDTSSAVADDKKSDEISFDFPLVDEQELPAFDKESSSSSQNDANNFDFSAISLDLSDNQPPVAEAAQVAADIPVAAFVAEAAVENENPDIDIKLDLVKVYIDMEDIEGARDLLDEVLKEGGPQQRSTAEKLLASLA